MLTNAWRGSHQTQWLPKLFWQRKVFWAPTLLRPKTSTVQISSKPLHKARPILGPEVVNTTRVNEKITAVSLDTLRPSSTIGVFFNFGTLNESGSNADFVGCSKLLEDLLSLKLSKWKYRDKVQVQVGPMTSSIFLTFRRNLMSSKVLPELSRLIRECIGEDVELSRDIVTHYEKNRDIFLHQDPALYFDELLFVSSFESFGTRFLPASTKRKPPQVNPGDDAAHNMYYKLPVSNSCPSKKTLASYLQQVVRPAKMVVAGCDVAHQDIVDFASGLSDILSKDIRSVSPSKPSLQRGISIYPHPTSVTSQAALTIDTTPLDKGLGPVTPLSLAPTFIQFLLGGGDSFSSGGPGKGMFSRLQTNVLPLEGVETCLCFGFRIPGCSALGVRCDTDPAVLGTCLQLVLSEIDKLTNKIPEDEMERVRNQMSFALWAGLERAQGIVEELGRHCIQEETGPILDLRTFEQALASLDEGTIKEAAEVIKNEAAKCLTILVPEHSLTNAPQT
eukprot:Blabericola_migrator_1__2952@NODE_184_length_11839_cov_88_277438_g159_i0_p3_GENE_NODE_184_length_11839_cov_88_277438_g159_i0NODE_184_length_11839_cov_88_277438_g159_i0_p3_ORF_typecomplete_len504_score101_20Peptidase_M16_C/PF05193_21/5e07_NODE_184_length_11839_cov_88_277438_g159_i015713082